MSERLWHLLSGKLDEIAALYKVRPRITLIVRVPGKPKECAFLSDDSWADAVATVRDLHCDPTAFAAGPQEPVAEARPAPPPAGDGITPEAAAAMNAHSLAELRPASDEVREAALTRNDAMTLVGHAEYLRRVHGEEDMPRFFDGLARRLLAALAARGERGE